MLKQKYFAAKGMVGEVVMRCRIVENQLDEMESSGVFDLEKYLSILDSIDQCEFDLAKYSQQMDQFEKEISDGTCQI